MKPALKFAIRGFWILLGSWSLYALTQMIWWWAAGHFLHELLTVIMGLTMTFLLTTFVFAAWCAVFRFSAGLVKPTVLIVSLVLLDAAFKFHQSYIQPMVERNIQSNADSLYSIVSLLSLLLIIIATIKFYKVTSALIIRTLFPEIAHSGARAFLA